LSISDISPYLGGKITIFCHRNADPDAFCSAYAVEKMIRQLNCETKVEIICPKGINLITKKIMNYYNIIAQTKSEIKGINTIIIVDTGSIHLLEGFEKTIESSNAHKIFIDHHAKDKNIEKIASLYIIDEHTSSTCELVYRIYKQLGLKPDEKVAQMLLIGITFDSRHFLIGNSQTFKIVGELLDLGADLHKALDLLSSELGMSEKIARLKASQRMTLKVKDSWVIASTDLGSFQSSAARGLLTLGADVVVVANQRKGSLKASLRSSNKFSKKTGIDLGDIAKSLAVEFSGNGSGHASAAGMNGLGDEKKFLKRAVDLIVERLGDKGQNMLKV
jgi:phosphoesterase RecJ-like protein